ncbi:unnamed protein product [Leuciscus chuanchicus]
MRRAECWTDHIMVRSKLLMSIQPRGPRTAPNKKRNCTALNSLTTKDNLRRLLAENLNMIPEEPGLHKAHKALLSFPGSPTHITTFTAARAETQVTWLLATLPDLPPTMHLDTPPLYSELRQAIAGLKNNKSVGPDGIPAEVFKHGGYTLMRRLHLLIQNIWEHGTLPQDWKDANIVVIYKQKGDRAVNSRGISLLSIAGKVLAKIMLSRLVKHISEAVLPGTQCGFRKSRSMIDMVFKAFDTINRELLWNHLSKIGVPPKFLSILQQLHDGMQARVLTGELQSESFEVFSTTAATLTAYAAKRKKTVYILSSMHSVIQTENTTKRKPNTITLYNTTKCGVDVMDQMVREYTVRTGTRRWPVAVFYNMIDMAALNAHVLYQACTGRQERRVDFLLELARELANSHMCAKKARKEQLLRTQPSTPSPGKRAMCQVKHQCKNNHATVRCVHCYRYTCEPWTPYRQHIINLDAFHIRCLQKILSLSWKDRIPHTVILSNTDSICMEAAVAKKHLRWIGHTIRMPEHCLPRQVLLEGKNCVLRTIPGTS